MLPMPGKNNFSNRFNPYRWSAPVYEDPEEVIEAVKSSHLISKRLRSVRVIGEAVPCFKTKGSGSAPTQEPRINCFEAQEPFIFEFDDGSTLEFWPQGPDYLRMACSTISSAIKNGMSFNTPIFQEFFAGVFGESWQGYEFKDFEIVRIKHKAKVTSSIKGKIKEDIGDEIYYRFRFGNDCCFEFRPNPTGDKYDIFFSHGDSNSVPSSQLNSLSDGSDLLTHICWSTAPFCDSVDIHPHVALSKKEKELSAAFKKYVDSQANFSVSEDYIPLCLYDAWSKHFEPFEDDEDHSFCFYGQSLFTSKQMRLICGELRQYIEKIKDGDITTKEQSEVLRWANSYSQNFSENQIDAARLLLADFLEQYCELTEGIMALRPDCEYITVMGP